MSIEKLMQALLTATPAQRRAVEEALCTDRDGTKATDGDTRLITIGGAAKLIGVGRNTLYHLIDEGRLDCVQLGGDRRVTMRSIREFVRGERPANEKTAERRKAWAKTYADNKAKAQATAK